MCYFWKRFNVGVPYDISFFFCLLNKFDLSFSENNVDWYRDMQDWHARVLRNVRLSRRDSIKNAVIINVSSWSGFPWIPKLVVLASGYTTNYATWWGVRVTRLPSKSTHYHSNRSVSVRRLVCRTAIIRPSVRRRFVPSYFCVLLLAHPCSNRAVVLFLWNFS